MRLKTLHIYTVWSSEGDKLTGTIQFENSLGEIQLNLSPEQISRILPVVADSLVASAKEVATELSATVIEQSQLQLEAPSNE